MPPEANEFDFESAGTQISDDLFGGQEGGDDLGFLDGAGEGEAAPQQQQQQTGDPAATPEEPSPAAGAATPAPKTWRPEAAAKWATLPAEIQAEVLKREDDIFKGLEGYKADANIGRSVKQIIAPYEQMFQAAGLDPLQQLDGLMKAHHLLATGSPEQKAMLFQRLAQDYGVDLSGGTPYVDPQVAGLQKQLADLQSRLMGREAREAQTARESMQREINTFASDPAHPYFDEVANDIAALLKAGAAANLAEAYEKAVWANPVTRAKEQSRLSAEQRSAAEAEAAKAAQQARKATGANVASKARPAGAAASKGSIDDTLQETLAAIKSRA